MKLEEKFLEAGLVDESKIELNREIQEYEMILDEIISTSYFHNDDPELQSLQKELDRIKNYAKKSNKKVEKKLNNFRILKNNLKNILEKIKNPDDIEARLVKAIFEEKKQS